MMMMMQNKRQDALEFLSLVACENDNSTEARGRASSCGRKRSFYFRPFEMEMSRPSVQRVCIVNHMVLEFGRALRVDQKNGTAVPPSLKCNLVLLFFLLHSRRNAEERESSGV